MESATYQVKRLQRVLDQLDPHIPLAPDDNRELLWALANTTAIASRVAEMRGRHRPAAEGEAALPSGSDEFASKHQAVYEYSQKSMGGHPAMAGHKASLWKEAMESLNDVVDVVGAECTVESRPGVSLAQTQNEWDRETVASVARKHNISIQELRAHNPQLSSFSDEVVLPENTYIKLRAQRTLTRASEDVCSTVTYEGRGADITMLDDVMSAAECPMPLAPLPAAQEERSRAALTKRQMALHQPTKMRSRAASESTESLQGPLLTLPTPSPVRRRPAQGNEESVAPDMCRDVSEKSIHRHDGSSVVQTCDGPRDDSCNIIPNNGMDEGAHLGSNTAIEMNHQPRLEDLHSRSEEMVDSIAVNASYKKSTNSSSGIPLMVVPLSLFSGLRASRPPMVKSPPSTPRSCTTDINSSIRAPSRSRPHPEDGNDSFMAQPFSRQPVAEETPNGSPNVKQPEVGGLEGRRTDPVCELVANASRREMTGTQPTVRQVAHSEGPTLSIRANSPICEDFDTLSSIATQYRISVKDVQEWNPHLNLYKADDPLPPNIPLVLPVVADKV
ncbi:hypothetical protein TRVL_07947 [Trypanosoma vivax]|nr:hypothetical protein TRVL_07947 [Trypanosoma vivax]